MRYSYNAREYYREKAIQTIKSEIDNVEIFIINDDEEKNIFSAMGFRGKCKKHDFYFTFKSHDKMFEYAEKYIEDRKKAVERKEQYRKENKGKLSPAALASKMIKQELKENFPTIKFSVRSDNFANGDSVDIYYKDGPTSEEVEKIVNKYQYGHFDGMTDMYEYSNTKDDIPQSKYVMVHREMSEKIREELKQHIIKNYSNWGNEGYWTTGIYNKKWNCNADTMMWRIFSKSNLTNKKVFAEL